MKAYFEDERPFDCVASVYGAKATRTTLSSTFHTVDRVKFDVVATVYREAGWWFVDRKIWLCPVK